MGTLPVWKEVYHVYKPYELTTPSRSKGIKHETTSLKKENVKEENLHGMDKEFETRLDGTLCIRMARHGSRHRHLYQQVLDVFKEEGRLSKAIRFTGTIRNTPLEMRKYSHGFYHKPAKDNKLLLHDLGNHDRQKNYIDVRRMPLEFQVEDKVMLKIIAKVGTVANRLKLPEQLSRVHKPVKIMDRKVKRLKQSRILIVKVRWNSRRGPEFTWECEDQMQKMYPHLFVNFASVAEVAP
ncbi:hypothetical protein Tco_1047306 [Tanacetum coccineum]